MVWKGYYAQQQQQQQNHIFFKCILSIHQDWVYTKPKNKTESISKDQNIQHVYKSMMKYYFISIRIAKILKSDSTK